MGHPSRSNTHAAAGCLGPAGRLPRTLATTTPGQRAVDSPGLAATASVGRDGAGPASRRGPQHGPDRAGGLRPKPAQRARLAALAAPEDASIIRYFAAKPNN